MIQRIQSIWLLLAALCSFAALKFPFFSGTNATGIPSSTLEGTDSLLLICVTLAVGIISLITIFLFNNRGTQIKLTLLAVLLEAVLIYLYYDASRKYLGGTYALTSILQPAILVFLFLAFNGIRKDNKIIKESNRLR